MSDTKAERLAGALSDFLGSSPNAEAAAVVSFDGLTMASALPEGMDEERMGAMSAALLGLGEQAAVGLGRGELRQLFVEGDGGYVFLMSARDEAVLAVVTDEIAKIGFVLFEMRRAADIVGHVLAGTEDEILSAPGNRTSSYGDPVEHAEALAERERQWQAAEGDAGPGHRAGVSAGRRTADSS